MSAFERGRSVFVRFLSFFDNSEMLTYPQTFWGFTGSIHLKQFVRGALLGGRGQSDLTESLILAQSERWRRG